MHEHDGLPPHLLNEIGLDEIGHFFEVYKALEPEKSTETRGWEGRGSAEAAVDDARRRYAEQGGA